MHHGRSNGGTCSCGSSCFAPGSSGISVMAKRTDFGRCVSLNRYDGDRRPADSLHIRFVYHACTSIRAFANLLASVSLRVTSLKFLLIIALAIAYFQLSLICHRERSRVYVSLIVVFVGVTVNHNDYCFHTNEYSNHFTLATANWLAPVTAFNDLFQWKALGPKYL